MNQSRKGETALGPIDRDKAYPRRYFRGLVGWSDAAFRQAVRNGLIVHRVGKQDIVMGSNFIDWVEAEAGD